MAIEEPIEADEAIIESASESISETKKVQDSTEKYKVRIEKVNGWYGAKRAIKDVNLNVKDNAVTAFIGPSGCGKTTLLRCLNRMHEMTPGAHADGRVVVDGIDIYDKSIDPVVIRRRIGMVFQKPNPFPTMSIFDNVSAGLRLNGMNNKTIIREIVEESLKNAALWEEVKNELDKPGMSLSGGQQQRLCIARALAMQPEVLLMDEPTSSLDPIGSSKIEELVRILKDSVTIIIVTHNMQQAARVSDFTAFMYLGDLIEYGATNQIFMKPEKELTERYISGKFG
ncbi:MAG: phosphate ABC transporter ATP-binding protein PstB [Nitrososphaeraceae archaeon]|nr:phosphate ABC transporter ATP-binding protein PstB [Nitrososphaeraceae archaeon]MDW0203606.1 phosphate ABC transporter ATP-binding protein PstB [Nitrososphaeraceae archaeon]MDW0231975.1 phosphate ABC transporter ATP-binding protein PstB [Nitrososphaeraceae archaeon]